MPKFFITTAIDYPNGIPHIGHAYEKVLADVIARYRRLCGDEVFFLTGVDQHGQKMLQTAEQEGVNVATLARRNTRKFLALWEKLGVNFDGWAERSNADGVVHCQYFYTDVWSHYRSESWGWQVQVRWRRDVRSPGPEWIWQRTGVNGAWAEELSVDSGQNWSQSRWKVVLLGGKYLGVQRANGTGSEQAVFCIFGRVRGVKCMCE